MFVKNHKSLLLLKVLLLYFMWNLQIYALLISTFAILSSYKVPRMLSMLAENLMSNGWCTTVPADIAFESRDICNGDESLPNPCKYEDMLVDLKAQADALARYANDYDSLLTCVLRPSNVFEPGDTYIVPFLVNHTQSGWPKFIIGSGENMADFTFVENVAHALICAEEALVSQTNSVAGKAFFITNLEPVKLWKFVSLILEGLAYQRPSVNIPATLALCICLLFKMMHENLGSRKHDLSVSAHYILELASRSRTFNCTAAQKLIGYSPIVSLEEGLTSTIKSFSHLSKDSSFSRYGNSSEGSRVEKLLGGGKVVDILLWRDEKKSFTYFLAMVLLIYLFFLSGRTFVSSSAYLLILASVFLYVNAIYRRLCKFGFSTQKISFSLFEISEIRTRNSAMGIADFWNRMARNLRSLGEGKDWCLFFQVAASIYFFKIILLHLTSIILFVLVFAFIMFFVYEQYKKEIDEFTITLFNTLKNSMRLLMKNLPASVTPFLHQYGFLQNKACTMQKDQQ